MNAGPDVERLISDWLVEEAPVRAPDRILGAAAQTIKRTKQRRFGAAWREPMSISSARLAAAAAAFIVVVVGAAWIGRSTAGVGSSQPTQTPIASSSPSPSAQAGAAVTLTTYRAARDAVCAPLSAQLTLLNAQLDGLFVATTPADKRNAALAALEQIATLEEGEANQLAAIEAPPNMAAEHTTDLNRRRDVAALLRYEVSLVRSGSLADAEAVDKSTDAISQLEASYQRSYLLADCP